jgi:hypothetical protein
MRKLIILPIIAATFALNAGADRAEAAVVYRRAVVAPRAVYVAPAYVAPVYVAPYLH